MQIIEPFNNRITLVVVQRTQLRRDWTLKSGLDDGFVRVCGLNQSTKPTSYYV